VEDGVHNLLTVSLGCTASDGGLTGRQWTAARLTERVSTSVDKFYSHTSHATSAVTTTHPSHRPWTHRVVFDRGTGRGGMSPVSTINTASFATENSLGQLTPHPLNWPSFGKGGKLLLTAIVPQPHQTMFQLRHCNPSRIRNIKIERSKQLYHNNTRPLFSPLPKLGHGCDVSWPRKGTKMHNFKSKTPPHGEVAPSHFSTTNTTVLTHPT